MFNAIGDTSVDLIIGEGSESEQEPEYNEEDIYYEEVDDKIIYYEYDPVRKVFH